MTLGRGVPAAAALATLLTLPGCSSTGSEPTAGRPEGASAQPARSAAATVSEDERPSAVPPATSHSPAVDAAAQVTGVALSGDEPSTPIATAAGVLRLLHDRSSPVVVDVLEVRAGDESTLLRWRLRSAGPGRVRTYTSALSRPGLFDTRAVVLVDEQGRQRLHPYTYVPQARQDDNSCVCSDLSVDVGPEGLVMYALYPPLSPQTTTVDVVLPGVPAMRDIAVTGDG